MGHLDGSVEPRIPSLEPLTGQDPPDGVDDGHVEQGGRLDGLSLRLLQHPQEVSELVLDKFGHRLLAEPEITGMNENEEVLSEAKI